MLSSFDRSGSEASIYVAAFLNINPNPLHYLLSYTCHRLTDQQNLQAGNKKNKKKAMSADLLRDRDKVREGGKKADAVHTDSQN